MLLCLTGFILHFCFFSYRAEHSGCIVYRLTAEHSGCIVCRLTGMFHTAALPRTVTKEMHIVVVLMQQ